MMTIPLPPLCNFLVAIASEKCCGIIFDLLHMLSNEIVKLGDDVGLMLPLFGFIDKWDGNITVTSPTLLNRKIFIVSCRP